MATFKVSPSEGTLVDALLHIKIEGLSPAQEITLYASVKGDGDDIFDSFALYRSDEDGVVDLKKQSSLGGYYYGTEPMGLFWSMKPSPQNKRAFSRLVVRNVEAPMEVEIAVYNLHLCYSEIGSSAPLAHSVVKRWYKSQRVRRVPVREGRLRGTLFIPEGPGPFPGVVDVFGSAGGLMEFRASLLASHGFVTFALAFFGYEDLPETAFEVELEYFEEAKDFLLNHPSVAKTGVGIIGVSVGGTLALAAATYVSGYTCAVVINGPIFAQYTSLSFKGRMWHAVSQNFNRMFVEENALILKHILDDHWDRYLGEASIEFPDSRKSFLFLFSGDDKAINSAETMKLAKRLLEKGTSCYKIVAYNGAGHLLEPPYSPHSDTTYTKLLNLPQRWGGRPKQHAEAQLSAWQETIEYLRSCLTRPSAKL